MIIIREVISDQEITVDDMFTLEIDIEGVTYIITQEAGKLEVTTNKGPIQLEWLAANAISIFEEPS